MFEEFSSGYYLGRLYVEPYEGDRAVIQRDQHERVNEQLYTAHAAEPQASPPLVMKLDNRHFPVHGEASVPDDTLAVPRGLFDECRVPNPPALKEVFLAKADRAAQLLEFSTGDRGVGT